MLQYILNMTAIWLISLLLFDVFLRRESYHGYNRLYLLTTFLMGILVPLWQWQDNGMMRNISSQESVQQVINTKQRMVTNTVESTPMNWEQWLLIIYLAGVFITLCILIADIVKLSMLALTGNRSKQDNWTIIETGKDHAPFSLRNMLFVCSVQQYTDEECNIILTHEQRHTSLLHFVDLLFMQLAKIVFWFHPLIYVYNRRLLMVHEYQADNAAKKDPAVYSRFLVEQAMLQRAPSITHSFNRSPIKNRIVMLTRRSSAASKSKMLVLIPLALVCIVCFSQNSFSQKFERNGKYVTYRGNKFELSEEKIDTVILIDPVTNQESTKIFRKDPTPVKMNGQPIVHETDKDPYYTGNDKGLRDFLIKGLKKELSKLDNGSYRLDISNIIVDANGKIVYFDYRDMKRSKTADEVGNLQPKPSKVINASDPVIKVSMVGATPMGNTPMTLTRNTDPAFYGEISKANQQEIFNKICQLMAIAPGFMPATLNGKKAIASYYDARFFNHFQVKDHILYDADASGVFKPIN